MKTRAVQNNVFQTLKTTSKQRRGVHSWGAEWEVEMQNLASCEGSVSCSFLNEYSFGCKISIMNHKNLSCYFIGSSSVPMYLRINSCTF